MILENIIENAIKFSPAGGKVFITTRVESNKEEEDTAVISIKDEGPGISKRTLKIFLKKFNQGDIKALKSLGVGLGLNIAREFAELMEQKLRLKVQKKWINFLCLHP